MPAPASGQRIHDVSFELHLHLGGRLRTFRKNVSGNTFRFNYFALYPRRSSPARVYHPLSAAVLVPIVEHLNTFFVPTMRARSGVCIISAWSSEMAVCPGDRRTRRELLLLSEASSHLREDPSAEFFLNLCRSYRDSHRVVN